MTRVEIVPVDGMRTFMAFCRLPRLLYEGLPGFSPSLDAERWTLYAAKLNPHFKLVDSQAFLARKDGRNVGRVLVQRYKDGTVPNGASRGQFGCLDTTDDRDVVEALMAKAAAWLLERGETVMHGPFSPSVNSEIGVLVQGFEATPMVFMPWNPPTLPANLEALGFTKARDLISYRYDVTEADKRAGPSILSRPEWRDRLKIRTLDLKRLKSEAAILVDIFNDAWSDNWGFVPFTLEEFLSIADGLKFVMPPEGGFIIELDGVAQAFGIVLPNLHEITADLGGRLFPFNLPRVISRIRNHSFNSGRLALFGLRATLQRKAIGGVVILAFIEEMRRRSHASSIEHVEFGWVLENNTGMRRPIEMAGAKVDKIHRIYEKVLAKPALPEMHA